MVYKKIGNKIPSLSSLLLAGVLLGSSCPKDKRDAVGDDKVEGTEQGAEGKESKDGSMKVTYSSNFIAANKEIKKIFFRALGLDYLPLDRQKEFTNQPDVLSENDYSKANIIGLADRLTNSFRAKSKFYPLGLRGDLTLLADIDPSYIKERPRAFATALNEIAVFCKSLHGIASQMWEKVDKGEGDASFIDLKEKSLDSLLEALKPGSTKFRSTYKFSDTFHTKLLDGAQLARFLTDLDPKGKPKGTSGARGNPYGIPAVLDKKFSVCIKNKKDTEGCKTNTQDDLSYIGSRGSGLGTGTSLTSTLLLKDNEGTLPFIAPLPNNTLKYRYDQYSFTNYVNDGTFKDADNKDQPYTINEVFKADTSFGYDAMQNSNVLFGTLLFTLFRGSAEYDFLELTEYRNTVALKGIDAHFKKWVDKSEGEFANMLYQHINTQDDLKELFVIPDLKDLYTKVLPASNTSDNDPALREVCVGILNALGVNASSSDDLPVLVPKLEKVSDLANCNQLNLSDANFNQQFCISLAKKILEKKSNSNFDTLTKKDLDDIVKQHGVSFADTAVVKLAEDGQVCPTNVTKSIKSNLDYIYEQLKIKSKDANRTYASIASKVQTGKFDIENVRKVYEKECNKLASILLTGIAPLLDKKEDITEDDLKQIRGLKAEEIDQINKIKQSYQAKQTQK